MRTISEVLATKPADKLKEFWKDAVGRDWYFTGWKQKLFIIFCFIWTILSVSYLIWRSIG